jgi:hypothetical protein
MTNQIYMRVNARGQLVERIQANPRDAWHTAYSGEEGSFLIEGDFDAALWWFDGKQLVERPSIGPETVEIAADGADTFSLVVPADGEVFFLAPWPRILDTSDGSFAFQTTVPGEYRFDFDCFPYRRQTITVTAQAV